MYHMGGCGMQACERGDGGKKEERERGGEGGRERRNIKF